MPIESHTFPAEVECRYLLHVPGQLDNKPIVVITLHGYGSNPEAMLHLTTRLIGEHRVIASIQAPYQHYSNPGLPNAESVPSYNWGIRPHWESAVRTHHDIVAKTLAALQQRFEVGPKRCLLVGFSQPVGLNYRFVATHPGRVGGVIGICGGIPRDWEEVKYSAVDAALLHISRDEDEYYPLKIVETFGGRLRRRASDVEFHLIPGLHRFPSKADQIVSPWINRVFGC